MEFRSATPDDLPAITELQRRYDVAWFGAAEHSADEVAEFVGWADPLSENSLLALERGQLVGTALRFGPDTALVTEPGADVAAIFTAVLPWFADRPGYTEVLDRDAAAVSAIEAAGWAYDKSMFDLLARVGPGLALAEPEWPAGVVARNFDAADVAAIHRLIYVDAGWAEVPGHPERAFDDWLRLFVTEHTVPEQQVIAWRGPRIVGVAMGRMWDDGTGWISQLAVAKAERGRGLGRALLLEALRRWVAGGATSLGLGVQAENRNALRLYLDAGLRVDREFRTYRAPSG